MGGERQSLFDRVGAVGINKKCPSPIAAFATATRAGSSSGWVPTFILTNAQPSRNTQPQVGS